MIYFDDITGQKIKKQNPNLATISESSIQNINYWRLWIWENKWVN